MRKVLAVILLFVGLFTMASAVFSEDGMIEVISVNYSNGTTAFRDPTGITFDGTWIWMTEQHASGTPLYKIDPSTMEVVETRYLSLSNCCIQGLAWDGQYIWISGNGYTIYRYDPETDVLEHTCTRGSVPQAIGMACVGSELYATAWYGGLSGDLMSLNPYDCAYDIDFEFEPEMCGSYGLANNGENFLVCARDEADLSYPKKIYEYSPSGELLQKYGTFESRGAYDLAWDGEFVWVAHYGSMYVADGAVMKVRLVSPIEVFADIRPASCPNSFNPKNNGVLPAAIVGTTDFDVDMIDPSTIRLEGVPALSWKYEDVTTVPVPGECSTEGPDGIADFFVKFNSPEIAAVLGDVEADDIVPLELSFTLYDGRSLAASDLVIIRGFQGNATDNRTNKKLIVSVSSAPGESVQRISFNLPVASTVRGSVYDVRGRLVKRVVDSYHQAGLHTVNLDSSMFTNGVYFLRLAAGDEVVNRKIIIIR
ncbi:MAG: T9SS type A sorting domain-containing protein [Bacteroidales bacterium]|nr:T9SS type A sorting domain-containing protein [Candidatus Latescibacterota bacterium]